MVHSVASLPATASGIGALVLDEGSATAAWLGTLLGSRDTRDATDAAHALCTLYGGHPDPIESATARSDDPDLRRWLSDAAEAFAAERRALASVVAAAGPVPSTPNQAQSEAALAQQRHALDMLAHSDRAGCAIGAAVALVLDWRAVRRLIDRLAARASLELAPSRLPADEPGGSSDAGLARARLFGARQLLQQQRAMWLLLEARAGARAR